MPISPWPRKISEAARLTLETAAKTMENEPALLMALVDLAQGRNDNEEAARRLAEIEKKVGDTLEIRSAKARCLIQQKGKEGLPQLADFTKDVDKLPAAEQEPERTGAAPMAAGSTLLVATRRVPRTPIRTTSRRTLAAAICNFGCPCCENAHVAQDVDAAKQLADEIQSIDKGGAVTLYSQAVYDFTRYLADKANGKDGAAALSQARDKLLQAQRLRPTWVQVPVLLGDIAREQKDDDAALGYYQRAMELGNRDAETYAQVAFILYHRGRFDDADKVVKKFEQQQNTTTPEMGRLASRISYSRNDLKRALAMAKIPVEQSKTPQRNDILFLGQLYAMQRAIRGRSSDVCRRRSTWSRPTKPPTWRWLQLLVAASQQAESDGKPDDAKKLFADAEAKMAEAEQQVDPRSVPKPWPIAWTSWASPTSPCRNSSRRSKTRPKTRNCWRRPLVSTSIILSIAERLSPSWNNSLRASATDDTNILAWARRELARPEKFSRLPETFLHAKAHRGQPAGRPEFCRGPRIASPVALFTLVAFVGERGRQVSRTPGRFAMPNRGPGDQVLPGSAIPVARKLGQRRVN